MSNINDFQRKISDWASERGIFDKSNPMRQLGKTMEEVDELRLHIQTWRDVVGTKGRCPTSKVDALEQLREMIKDDIGDVIVTLSIQASMFGLTLSECLDQAYNDIKNRKGKMIDGMFVKEDK